MVVAVELFSSSRDYMTIVKEAFSCLETIELLS